jgi:8-oxo-dGTP diphosphatase
MTAGTAAGLARRTRAGLAVDLVVLTVRDGALTVLLVDRGGGPFRHRWALPGGFVHHDEELEDAAARELREETGLHATDLHLEQVRTYASCGRDPRGRVASVAYLAIAPDLPPPTAGSDASDARWVAVDRVGRLAFDHNTILADGVERSRSKLEYSPLAASFCPEPFTIGELRGIYEAVWGVRLDRRSFHRTVCGVDGFLVPTGERRTSPTGRPAPLYRRGRAGALRPAIPRPSPGGHRDLRETGRQQ